MRMKLLHAQIVVAAAASVVSTAAAFGAAAPGTENTKPRQDNGVSAAADPVFDGKIHFTGDIWMTVFNDGRIGSESRGIQAPSENFMDSLNITYGPSFEFPAGTLIDYLFNGSLWVGGIVGPDTLVSQQKTSGSGDAAEFNGFVPIHDGVAPGYPASCIGDTATRQLTQSFTAVYQDTILLANQPSDRSGRPHLPLGIEVVQTSHQAADNFSKRFVIYDYVIRNISPRPIDRMWFGIFMDNDVFWDGVSGCTEGRTEDDWGGCLTTWPNLVNPIYTDSLMVAWACDNDGDRCNASNFPRVSARGVMGVRVLRKPTPDAQINFNWFTTNFANIDWGPRLASDDYNIGSGGTGLPEGDHAVYHVMANGEIDYSQPFSAISFQPEWQRPAPSAAAENIANGLDSRVLLSSGPYPRLQPGETVAFTVAFIAGADLHYDETNVFDKNNPQAYLDKMDFSDLATNAWWAGFVWDNYGFDTDGDGYSGEYYRPVIGGDTIYYTGDGCPDLSGPAPPPGPTAANSDLQLISRPHEIIVTWSGKTTETTVDPLQRRRDFEGYKVYLAERASLQDQPASADYALIASWDRKDYRRYIYNQSNNSWSLSSHPYTKEEWQELLGRPDFDPELYTSPSYANAFIDTLFSDLGTPRERRSYFRPQESNSENTYVVGGDVEQNLIQRVAVVDTVIDGVPSQYGRYEIRLPNLLPSKTYFVSITAFDFGDPFNNLDPLETSVGTVDNRVSGIPIYSADVVAEYDSLGGAFKDSVRVSVYPNPYKIQFDDGTGRLTSYFTQGFEGATGQEVLNEDDRRIHFINVPDTCVINIYTLDGDLVRTLNHPHPNLSGYSSKISWDLISRNTQAVTSGIYIYRVESRLGVQTGKIVIIK